MQTRKEYEWNGSAGICLQEVLGNSREITCQSYNYVIVEKSCELNNRTKEATPENFQPDSARFYYTRFVGRGMC